MTIDVSIPLVDPRRMIDRHGGAIERAVERVITQGVFTPDEEVAALEAEFARWLGRPHAVATGSGSAALSAALHALGIGRGDRVAIAANLDISAVGPILQSGAQLAWVDIDHGTTVMSADDLAAVVDTTDDLAAIVVVHTHGFVADIARIAQLASAHGIPVVEDITHAPGALHGTSRVGTHGRVAVMSCAPTKPLAAIGNAGLAATDDPDLAQRMAEFLAYGFDPESVATLRAGSPGAWYGYRRIGMNGQPDELQAAVLRVQLTSVDADAQRRARNQRRTAEALSATASVAVMSGASGTTPAPRYTVIVADDRDAHERTLRDEGIGFARHYVPSLHRHAVFDGRASDRSLPVTDRYDAGLVCVPCGPTLADCDVDRVTAALTRGHSRGRPG